MLKYNTKDSPDKKLIALVVKGDQKAFRTLVDRHMIPVFRFSYSLLQDTGRAEDITQDTFMTLWQNADTWEPTGQLRSWLFRIARNKSIDEIRRRKDFIDIDKSNIKDGQKSPYRQTLDHEITAIVDQHLQELPERQREAVMLVNLLGCTNIEAAETMDISVDAMESLLARGRKKLRVLLDDHKNLISKGRE